MRDGVNEREDDVLGPRHETTLRLGDRIFVRNANGNVRELRGYLRRRALTEDLLDTGDVREASRAHALRRLGRRRRRAGVAAWK